MKSKLAIQLASLLLVFGLLASCSAPPSVPSNGSSSSNESSSGSSGSSVDSDKIPSIPHFYFQDGLCFYVVDGQLLGLTSTSGEPLSGKIVIPSTIGGQTITSISDHASIFRDKTLITEVVFPDTLTELPHGILWGCSGLKKVTLPRNLTIIPDYAFIYCKSLAEIKLPSEVYKIGEHAFSTCLSLKKFVLPSKVAIIGSGAFHFCENLQEIYLPKSLESVGVVPFSGCFALEKVHYAGTSNNWENIEFPRYDGSKEFLQSKLIFDN